MSSRLPREIEKGYIMSELWPSQKTSTSRATKSTYRAQAIPTDWTSGILMFLFVVALVGGVAFAAFHFAIEPAMAHMQQVMDTVPAFRK